LTKWKLNFFFVLLFFFTYCIINIQKTAHYISKNSKKKLARGPPRLLSSIYYVHDDYYHFHEEKEEEEEETLAFILAVLCINDRGLRFPCNCCQQRNVGGEYVTIRYFFPNWKLPFSLFVWNCFLYVYLYTTSYTSPPLNGESKPP
jgi:hypothetical protein